MKPRQCSVCGIIERGACCSEVLTEYRGHLICSSCFRSWQATEKKEGWEVGFLKFKWHRLKVC